MSKKSVIIRIEMTEATIKFNERKSKALNMLGDCCAWCGTVDNLQFDHVNNDRKDKNHLLHNLLKCSWDRVVRELKLCQILCINCHGIKSQQDRGCEKSLHGKPSYYTNNGCRCSECSLAWSNYLKDRRNKKESM